MVFVLLQFEMVRFVEGGDLRGFGVGEPGEVALDEV